MKNIFFFIIILFITPIFSQDIIAACSPERIKISSGSSIGFDISGNGSSLNQGLEMRREIPFNYQGIDACFMQKSKLGFEIKSDLENNSFSGELNVYYPKNKFQNIEGGKTYSYLYIDDKDAVSINKDVTTEVSHFVCIDEHVLLVESFSGTFNDAQSLGQKTGHFSQIMAFGEAGRILARRKQINAMKSGLLPFLPKGMTQYLSESISLEDLRQSIENPIKLPSFYSNISLYLENMATTNQEQTTLISKNFGCTPEFIKAMRPYSLEELLYQGRLGHFKIKEKGFWGRDHIQVTW